MRKAAATPAPAPPAPAPPPPPPGHPHRPGGWEAAPIATLPRVRRATASQAVSSCSPGTASNCRVGHIQGAGKVRRGIQGVVWPLVEGVAPWPRVPRGLGLKALNTRAAAGAYYSGSGRVTRTGVAIPMGCRSCHYSSHNSLFYNR